MKITGIIAEYNPFHNGHACQLKRAREETNADYMIVVMSGNFVQRGAPALLDKSVRTEMALLGGADLVIELPVLWAAASAEYFAAAGVSLLRQLGCIHTLCYGCETLNQELYAKLCQLLICETEPYRQLLSCFLKQGANYALAREKAILAVLQPPDETAVTDIIRNPNNILALEYQKAIARYAPSIKPCPILRRGQAYHSKEIADTFASASAIRAYLAKSRNKTKYECLKRTMPAAAYDLLQQYQSRYPLLYPDDCSQMLHYCLLRNAADGFCAYADCTADFSNKIRSSLDDYTGFSDFCIQLKSKNMAYTRISRILLHILLDVRQTDYTFWRSHSFVPYAGILGFRRESAGLLAHLKAHSSIPLLTRAADAKKILSSKDSYAFFEKNLFADSVYRALVMEKGGQALPNEYRRQIQIL